MIYLDNAATTFPKPLDVSRAMCRAVRQTGGNPGRGSHSLARSASDVLYSARERVAKHFGAESENVVFTQNATYALNIAIKAVARRGYKIVMSDMEHNSVSRPVYALAKQGVSYDFFTADGDADKVIESLRGVCDHSAVAVACTIASNICQLRLPVREIGRFCRERGIIFIADVSQCAGSMDIDIERDGISILCAPGHKGLYGPAGSGVAVFSSDAANECRRFQTIIEGGSGTLSADKYMPEVMPERFEAGTVALPAIAGLCEGIKFVDSIGTDKIYAHECKLARYVRDHLCETSKIKLYGEGEGSIVLFNVDGIPSQRFASMLDERGICARAGLHCAPLAHARLKTGVDGAVRLSFSPFNNINECEETVRTIKELIR